MRYEILGPLQVCGDDGRPIGLGGRRERIVLAALLLDADRVVSTDRLIEAVWGDDPPDTATNALQVYVSRLRKALRAASADDVLATRAPGYVLRVGTHEIDSGEFERLMADAEGDADDPASRVARLDEALGLWRGRVLEDVADGTFGRAEVTRLEELRLTATQARFDGKLALGAHGQIVGELEALVGRYPFREALRGQLMVALYRSGRQADALEVFQSGRRLLAEELGIDPGPALCDLEVAILNHDPVLAPPPPSVGQAHGGVADPASPGRAPAPGGHDGTLPLPTRLGVVPEVGLVGRSRELATVIDAIGRSRESGGREVLLVAGEAGVGKSTLAAAAARAAWEQGAYVLFGHCEEGLAAPYQFFGEAFDHMVRHTPAAVLADDLGPRAGELARLVPHLAEVLTDLPPPTTTDADTERYLLFAAVVQLVGALAARRPVLLVLDDLHWADEGSLLLLRHLMAAEPVDGLLVLATYRDNELVDANALRDTLGALRRQGSVERIELGGLDGGGVVEYIEAAAGQDLDDDGRRLAATLSRETDGNPFFVGEVLRHLRETGAIRRGADGRWVTEADLDASSLPDSVREIIGGRVARLGEHAERLLGVAAVIGRDFDLDLLSRASGVDEDDTLELLDRALGAALVTEPGPSPGRFQFTHALIQRTLYEDLRPTRRARVHRQVAEALEGLVGEAPGGRSGELARHWVATNQPVDLAKAILYSCRAGDDALAALAPADALRFYNQALTLAGQDADADGLVLLEASIGMGTAMRQTGDAAFRDTLLHAARQADALGDTDRLVAAVLANTRGTFSTVGRIDEEKVVMLERALERLGADDVRRAAVLATLCTELTVAGSLERRSEIADEALAVARGPGDDATLVRVLNHVNLPLHLPHLLEQNVERTTEALTLAQSIGDPMLLCTAASGRRLSAGSAGDVEEMDRCFAIKQLVVDQLDLPFLNWVHSLQRATRALIAGDVDDAERLALTALDHGNTGGQPDAFLVYGTQLITVHLVRGTMGTMVPVIRQVIDEFPDYPVFRAVLALALSEDDRTAEVRDVLDGFATDGFRLPLDVTWLTATVALADAVATIGAPDLARPLVDQLAPFAPQWLATDVTVSGPVGRSVGDLLHVLGRLDEAEQHLEAAAASCEHAGARYFAARTALSRGRVLLARDEPGDLDRGRALLLQARDVAQRNGYGGVLRRADAALSA